MGLKTRISAFIGNQRYRCIGTKKYITEDDRKVQLLIMKSYCPDCGKQFQQLSTKQALINGSLNRRCSKCKRPGLPISATRVNIFGI